MLANPNTLAPRHPESALQSRVRRWLWALPLVASLAFVVGDLAWTWRADRDGQAERRATMIADALTKPLAKQP